MERMGREVPTAIAQMLLTPYLEFSRRHGGQDNKLLDCASGNGYQWPFLKDRFGEVYTIDKEKSEYLPSSRHSQIDLETQKIPFPDDFFDVVFSFETIEHLQEKCQKNFVEKLTRVGKLVIIGSISSDGPNYVGEDIIFKKGLGLNPYHKKEFTSEEWKTFFVTHFEHMIPIFFHSVVGPRGFEIRPGLDGPNGISNYVRLFP